jgi:uncharacterized protein with HEPN domain
MFDRALALAIVEQIDEALEKIKSRTAQIQSVEDFTDTPSGMERLDGLCMLFMAIGEALKNLDKITGGSLLSRYPEIDWRGAIGFRDIIAHHYFDIDAEQVFWICSHEVAPLSATIKQIARDLR